MSHPIDLLLLYHFFGSRFIIVIKIHNIMFGVDAGIIMSRRVLATDLVNYFWKPVR